jgi:hypothetical protein
LIEYGELFKNVIPLEMLGRFPLRLVHILREIRIKQKEEMSRRMNARANPGTPSSVNPTAPIGGIDSSALEEYLDELT